ncbi:MAG: anhydro-N-acetylmuramic acid kinase [Methylobacterium sp.]|nr:anhydro-N-acetylmuramic acid kinase [Methylobacterium sp.]MCA3658084.1 anhydro-N-acetylmuramic acid kinase [Methylobacterium sp.]MCA3661738.1 anhydro-N-acetylmuramic acid kinase [Methylobacterium sp.]MCA3664703.1 anhydro-N-acetylmuramic acid kinase [Methylobacterium sp.]MCA3670727.1 anhydro-N-acetylmuramic acid kinase [Methylobacterium sp.]
MQKPLLAIGAISGTSMDAIDLALVLTDGEDYVERMAGRSYPYPAQLKARLLDALKNPQIAETDPLTELENAVTDAFGQAILQFQRDFRISRADFIGLHGQTIWHRPEKRFTRQLGDGPRLAKFLRMPVVNRFRHADVLLGGQGAPLVPLYHAALAKKLEQPLVVLNLGGVANITYLDGPIIMACDTGPASALIDDRMRHLFDQPFDKDGAMAKRGDVDAGVLAALMDNPFFALPPPKSLDRMDFHARAEVVNPLPPANVIATLTAFTIEATVAVLRHLPKRPKRWLVTGGGRHNRSIMAGLMERLGVPVEPVESVGWKGDFLEAECFAYLAIRSSRGLPLSLPTTTGVPRPLTGGETHWP